MPANYNKCLHCGKEIRKGRLDKKFCDDACKDAYNNALKADERGEISKIDRILRKNRRILKKLCKPEKPEQLIARETIVKEGFEFGFHTHIVVTRIKKNEITFCYDYGYREMEKGKYQILKSFSKVDVKDGITVTVN